MKTKLLLLAIITLGCSKEEDNNCECSTVIAGLENTTDQGRKVFNAVRLCDANGLEVDYSGETPVITNKSYEQIQAIKIENGCN